MGSSQSQKDKTVIVVGGGVAGVAACKELDGLCNVVLLEKRESYVNPYSIHRDMVEGSYNSIIDYDYLFYTHGIALQGELTEINTQNNVITFKTADEGDSNKNLKQDYLIVATGSTLNQFKSNKTSEIKLSLDNISNKLEKSQNVAILGAGSIGIELAGEMRDKQPDLKISIVGKNLLSNPKGLPETCKNEVKKQLKEFKIDHIPHNAVVDVNKQNWDERIEFDSDVEINGTKSSFDVIINCTGQLPSQSLSINGEAQSDQFKVNGYLQKPEQSNIQFVGDCNTGLNLNKQAFFAGFQGKYAAQSILKILNNQAADVQMDDEQIKENKNEGSAKIFLPLTRKGGFGYMFGMNIPICIVQMVKNRDLFVGKARGEMNASDKSRKGKIDVDNSKITQWESKLGVSGLKESVLSVKSMI